MRLTNAHFPHGIIGALAAAGIIASMLAPHALSWIGVPFIVSTFLAARENPMRHAQAGDLVPAGLAVAFLIWALIACLWSPDRALAIKNVVVAFLTLAVFCLSILFARSLAPLPRSSQLSLVVAHAVLACALLTVVLGWFNPISIRGERTDISSSSGSWAYNRAALLFAFLIPIMFSIFNKIFPNRKTALSITLVWTICSVFLLLNLKSESATLSIAIMIVFYFMATNYPRIAGYILFLGTSVFVVAAPFLLLATEQWMRTWPFLLQFRPGTILARLEIWWAISRQILEAPVLGYGIDAVRNKVINLELYKLELGVGHPHSMALQLWVDLGGVGVLLCLGLFGSIIFAILRNPRPLAALQLTILAGVVTVSAVSHGMWQSWWYGLIGIVFLIARSLGYHVPATDPPTSRASINVDGTAQTQIKGAAVLRLIAFAIVAVVALFAALAARVSVGFALGLMPKLSLVMLAAAVAAWRLPLMQRAFGGSDSRSDIMHWLAVVLLTISLFALFAALAGVIASVPRSVYMIAPAIMIVIIFAWEFVAANVAARWSLLHGAKRDHSD